MVPRVPRFRSHARSLGWPVSQSVGRSVRQTKPAAGAPVNNRTRGSEHRRNGEARRRPDRSGDDDDGDGDYDGDDHDGGGDGRRRPRGRRRRRAPTRIDRRHVGPLQGAAARLSLQLRPDIPPVSAPASAGVAPLSSAHPPLPPCQPLRATLPRLRRKSPGRARYCTRRGAEGHAARFRRSRSPERRAERGYCLYHAPAFPSRPRLFSLSEFSRPFSRPRIYTHPAFVTHFARFPSAPSSPPPRARCRDSDVRPTWLGSPHRLL